MTPLRLLDLFSGIGGFSLGLERSGAFRTVAFCEIEPFPRKILAKHWPDVPCYDDVRTLSAKRLADDGIAVDAICGGFPCQDISLAGNGAGLSGERSGLWRHLLRSIRVVRPLYAVVENVAALLGRGMGDVLGDLAEIGYDAEWHCISARAVGAPHLRDRVWIVANDGGKQHEVNCAPLSGTISAQLSQAIADADAEGELQSKRLQQNQRRWPCYSSWWSSEPEVERVVYGVPGQVDRISGLGNAVVPQVVEMIGRPIATQLERRSA